MEAKNQLDTSKKSTKSLNPFQRYWRFVILENFRHAGPYPTKTITLQLPWMCNYMQQINRITQAFPEILAICYFGERWACRGMPDQTQQILHDLTKDSMDN